MSDWDGVSTTTLKTLPPTKHVARCSIEPSFSQKGVHHTLNGHPPGSNFSVGPEDEATERSSLVMGTQNHVVLEWCRVTVDALLWLAPFTQATSFSLTEEGRAWREEALSLIPRVHAHPTAMEVLAIPARRVSQCLPTGHKAVPWVPCGEEKWMHPAHGRRKPQVCGSREPLSTAVRCAGPRPPLPAFSRPSKDQRATKRQRRNKATKRLTGRLRELRD